jgi:hypothetical protein
MPYSRKIKYKAVFDFCNIKLYENIKIIFVIAIPEGTSITRLQKEFTKRKLHYVADG